MNYILESLSQHFPNLPSDLVQFFQLEKDLNKMKFKTLSDFIELNKNTPDFPGSSILNLICEKLSEMGVLSPIIKEGILGLGNSYLVTQVGDFETFAGRDLDSVKNLYSCLVYGFPFIFEKYRDAVTPIVHTKSDDSVTVGTGFFFRNYFITARHCLENSKNIAIKGLTRGQLLRASVKFHKDDNIDLAFFEVVDKNKFQVIDRQDIAKELDSVITIGFPKIPTFLAIQTVEQAQIASRLTVTRGEIAGAGTQYLAKTKMFLITAKIRGGNSGGPVLNAGGCVVGVAVQKASGEGNYDDLGYGSVIPYSYVEEMINGENVDAGKFEFVEFVE